MVLAFPRRIHDLSEWYHMSTIAREQESVHFENTHVEYLVIAL